MFTNKKCTPTHTQNINELQRDINTFCRRLKFCDRFLDANDSNTDNVKEHLARNKTGSNSRKSGNKPIEDTIQYQTHFSLDGSEIMLL